MKSKLVLGSVLFVILGGILTSVLTVQPMFVRASAPPDYAWVHGQVCKNSTHNLPLRGILLELWDNSSNTLVNSTISSDNDVNPGAFDFGNVYTGTNRTFFVKIVVKGYNATGYNMLDVVNETTGTLVHYDFSAFTCFSGQEYFCNLYGPNDGDPTTVADSAICTYYYVWLVYNYFRKNLGHYINHVTAHLIPGYAGAWGSSTDIGFGATAGEFHSHAFGHEYGHSVMFQIYNPRFYCNSTQGHTNNHYDRSAWNMCHNVLADPDFGSVAYPVPCSCDALMEGWANFVPWIAYGTYNYTYGPSWFGWWLDMKEGAGEKNEYGFTGILHDICNIPRQNQNTMMCYVWEVLTKDHPGSVVQFYEAFVTRRPELVNEVKTAYMKRFAVFSKLGTEVNATENGANLHVNVSGYLMPLPHTNKTVTVNYRMVGETSWTWLANVTTDSRSFFLVTANLPQGVYQFQTLWHGDRGHHTGHHGSASDIVGTDKHYIGSTHGTKFYTDKTVYYPGETVQIRIVNVNHTQKAVSGYSPYEGCLWPNFYIFSQVECNLQIFYPNGTLALNQSVLVPPFYGTIQANFTNSMILGSYEVKVSNHITGQLTSITVIPEFPLFLILPLFIMATLATAVYVKKRNNKGL